MKKQIKIPSFGESVVEVTVGSILKPSGSFVKADEEILELETDKLNQVLYSPASGKLELSVKTGDVVKVGASIGSIDEEAKGSQEEKVPPKKEEPSKKEEKAPFQEKHPEEKSSFPPARKKIDQAVDEIKPDTPKIPTPPPTPQEKPKDFGKETRQKMSKLRKVISKKLVDVKNQTAMLTTFNEVDMSEVMRVRKESQENFQKKHGVKLGFMSFFVKAVASALQEFPDINARIEKEEIVYHHYYDIGVAVSTDSGLMVPVIRNADLLSYAEIEKKLKEYADRARSRSISIDELQGGTFTITNGGVFGSLLSTPILNPPQSGILGMHNIVKRAVVINDQIVIRPMMYLALSYDHRIVDGKEAISFLMHIKQNLEAPARLLLDL